MNPNRTTSTRPWPRPDTTPTTVNPSRRPIVTAATVGAAGGFGLFCDLALHAFGPLGRSYFLVATVIALALLGVPTGYWLRGAIASGWRRGLAVAGTGMVAIGASAWITAFVLLSTNPGAAFTQKLTPAGSASMALGMILLGISVLASRRLVGLRSLAPLAVGLYFPVQLTVQLAFFLNGRDAAPGPNGMLLGAWGLLWAWAAWSVVAARDGKQPIAEGSNSAGPPFDK